MPRKYLRTSDIARTVGAHPNTVRLYEEWGFLPPIPRSRNGYRQFTESHRDHMQLAWTALHTDSWYGPKRILVTMVRQAAEGDLGGALEQAYAYLAAIRAEYAQAEAAVAYLERWSAGHATDDTARPLRIGQVAARLGLTHDTLRSWERNGLIEVPRSPRNGYRQYGPEEVARLRVIRMLRLAGYSLMAILRMVRALDSGEVDDLRELLDTPRPDEDALSAADSWLTALKGYEQQGQSLIEQLEAMLERES